MYHLVGIYQGQLEIMEESILGFEQAELLQDEYYINYGAGWHFKIEEGSC